MTSLDLESLANLVDAQECEEKATVLCFQGVLPSCFLKGHYVAPSKKELSLYPLLANTKFDNFKHF